MLTPAELGIPTKFVSFRHNQLETVVDMMDATTRGVAVDASTGTGKSLLAIAYAQLTGKRVAILTATKALQSQYLGDFDTMGMLDVRGQAAYTCLAAPEFGLEEGLRVQDGPCHAGVRCALKNTTCRYYEAIRQSNRAKLFVTNYQFWMTIHGHGKGLEPVDALILDEAHHADQEISSYMTVEIDEWSLESLLGKTIPRRVVKLEDWRDWASTTCLKSQTSMDTIQQKIQSTQESGKKVEHSVTREFMMRRNLHRQLAALAASRGPWVVEPQKRKLVFAPVWPTAHAESVLFRGVEKIIFMSATLRPKTLEILGVAPKNYTFLELPSSFPVENRRVISIPTVRMNAATTNSDLLQMVKRVDEIIDGRLDRKGIIHTVSYARRDFLLQHSAFRDIMVSHSRENTRAKVEEFKRLDAPSVFISPSITTGWDFADDAARYNIIMKLPYPDARSPIMAAKCGLDNEYQAYLVAQTIIQMAGRSTRGADDKSETFILDSNWQWFLLRNRKMFPVWFLEACVTNLQVPKPFVLEDKINSA